MRVAKQLLINGIVQGVGFRPFLYRLACQHHLSGTVLNNNRGVVLHIEGEPTQIQHFLLDLPREAPACAKIEQISEEQTTYQAYEDFTIIESHDTRQNSTRLSPDLGICVACLDELKQLADKRRGAYPFINCTNCGPRFTIIKHLPYDRKQTTMATFKMCEQCEREYRNPLDRRFHAQPTCCHECGPQYESLNAPKLEPFEHARSLLRAGHIIAFKGLGGYQLICDAKNEAAVSRLRLNKQRPKKPFAIMVKNDDVATAICTFNQEEKNYLLSAQKPIVVVLKKEKRYLSGVCHLPTLGVMLPYTPAHQLLFDETLTQLVVTSANLTGQPMIFEDEVAFASLPPLADDIFYHHRDIIHPIDDTVLQLVDETPMFFRKARGYSPSYVTHHNLMPNLFACGNFLKTTFSFTNEHTIVTSPYLGNIKTQEDITRYNYSLQHFKSLYGFEPTYVAHDCHEDQWYKIIFKQEDTTFIGINHHHAHLVSCLVDNQVQKPAIGLAFDGNGYGLDQTSWGSEFYVFDYRGFKRKAHLTSFLLPGGDDAAKSPWKMALSLLYLTYQDEGYEYAKTLFPQKETDIVWHQLKKQIHCPITCSVGRLFDGVAALLGFEGRMSYEAEAASYVEQLAQHMYGIEKTYTILPIQHLSDCDELDIRPLIKSIIDDVRCNEALEVIAMKFHQSLVEASVCMCEQLRQQTNLTTIALSGGVFQNKILQQELKRRLEESSFTVYTHQNIPCHDEGLSVGQLVIANEILTQHEIEVQI